MDYISEEALYGDDNLKLQVNSDVVSALNEGAVWQVPFFFRSSVWHGNPWDHPSLLYIPSELNPAYKGTIAVIQQVTLDLNPGEDQDAQFGLETALELGIPVAVLAKVPHPTPPQFCGVRKSINSVSRLFRNVSRRRRAGRVRAENNVGRRPRFV